MCNKNGNHMPSSSPHIFTGYQQLNNGRIYAIFSDVAKMLVHKMAKFEKEEVEFPVCLLW